jgi:hypothetical protein
MHTHRFLSPPRRASPASRARSRSTPGSPRALGARCGGAGAGHGAWAGDTRKIAAPRHRQKGREQPRSSGSGGVARQGGGFGADAYDRRGRRQEEQEDGRGDGGSPSRGAAAPQRGRSPGAGSRANRAAALVEAALNLEADLEEAREGAGALEARLRLAEEKIHSQVGGPDGRVVLLGAWSSLLGSSMGRRRSLRTPPSTLHH